LNASTPLPSTLETQDAWHTACQGDAREVSGHSYFERHR
jgi:hypothetical protein